MTEIDPVQVDAAPQLVAAARWTNGRFADVLLTQSLRNALAMILELIEDGLPARAAYTDILAPALVEVGSRWERGAATVAQEHLATAMVSSIMATLAPRLDQAPPMQRLAVLACAEGELHTVGLRMLADFLEGDGWEVLLLGADTPVGSLQRLVEDRGPAMVALSVTTPAQYPAVQRAIAAFRTSSRPPFIMVGGGALASDRAAATRLGADATATDAATASALLRARFGHA